MVAAFCVSCLAQRKEDLACVVADNVEDHARRVAALRRKTVYQRYVDSFGDFEIYVLDKLEAALRPTMGLDTHHYADRLETEVLLQTFRLSMLRLRPASDWRENDIGTLYTTLGNHQ